MQFPSKVALFAAAGALVLGACLGVRGAWTGDYAGALEFAGILSVTVFGSSLAFAFRIAGKKCIGIVRRLREWDLFLFLLIMAVFLAVNLALFPVTIGPDIFVFQRWGVEAFANSVSYLYVNHSVLGVDYPPLYMYGLYFNAWLNYQLTHSLDAGSFSYVVISKTIPLLCNLAIGLLLFSWLRKRSVSTALVGVALYLFNPAIIYATSYVGQIDSVYTLFLFLALKSLTERKYFFSALYASLAVLTKLQSLFLIPLLALVLISELTPMKLIDVIANSFGTIVVIMLPFILPGALGDISGALYGSLGEYPHVSVNAFNFWFPLGYHQVDYRQPLAIADWGHSLSDSLQIFGVSLKTVGLIVFAAFTFLVLYQVRKDRENMLLGSASLAFAFFMLPTEIHERYLFPFFAFFTPFALENRRYLLVYMVLTATYLLNMIMVFTYADTHSLFYFVYLAISIAVGYSSLYTVAVVISVINAVVFLYFCKIGILRTLRVNLHQDLKRIIMRAREQELPVELPQAPRRSTGWSPKRIGLNVLTIILIVIMVDVGFFGYHHLAGEYYQIVGPPSITISQFSDVYNPEYQYELFGAAHLANPPLTGTFSTKNVTFTYNYSYALDETILSMSYNFTCHLPKCEILILMLDSSQTPEEQQQLASPDISQFLERPGIFYLYSADYNLYLYLVT